MMTDALAFLERVLPAKGWSVVVAIHPDGKPCIGHSVSRETLSEIGPWLDQHAKWNLYWSVNETAARIDKKALKDDISHMHWVHGDIDDPSDDALTRLQTYRVPPTAIIFSGGGYQGIWRLREPVYKNGNLSALEGANKRIIADLGGDVGTWNLDRLMRLPGTTNWLNPKKRAQGRKVAETRLVEFHPDRVYTLADFPPPSVWPPVDATAKPVDQSAALMKAIREDVEAGLGDDDIHTKHAAHPHVAKLPAVADRTRAIARCIAKVRASVSARNAAADELNSQHAVVWVGNDLHVLWRNEWNNGMPRLSRPSAMMTYYRNRTVGKVNPFSAWLDWPGRAEFTKIVFEPGATLTPGAFNLWRGFAVEPAEGDCSLFLALVRDVICSGNADLYRYVIGWCADAVQNPNKRPGVVLVLKGKQGTGKGTFAHGFGRLFGDHYAYASRSRHVVGTFNAHLANKQILFADEAFFAGDRAIEGALKSMITEDDIAIEMKGRDVIKVRNHLRIIMASNQDWVVPAAMDDRRFAIIEVSPARERDSAYFAAINRQLESGGRAALLHHLMHFDLTGLDLRVLPKTHARIDQQLRSLGAVEKWWYARLHAGAPTSGRDHWADEVLKSEMFDDYSAESGTAGTRHRGNMTEFGMALHRLVPGLSSGRMMVREKVERDKDGTEHRSGGTRAHTYRLPSLAECRAEFAKLLRGDVSWPDEPGADRPWREGEV